MPPLSPDRHPFIRNLDAASYFEDFFLCAVGSIVAIRLYLGLTGYPQLGGNGLHIAHMLWGGCLMVVAIMLLLGFHTAATRRLAAVVAGIGFGAFIDELGKFITSDNNYLFRPAIALIYVVSVALYLALLYVARRATYSRAEYLVNALEIAKEGLLDELGKHDRERALRYLRRARAHDATADALAQLILACRPVDTRPNAIARAGAGLVRIYRGVTTRAWFVGGAIGLFVVQSLLDLAVLTGAVVAYGADFATPLGIHPGVSAWGGALSTAVAALLVLAGVLRFARSRLGAYHCFRYAVLVNIALVQFFAFYEQQLLGLLGLLLNVVVLKAVDYAMSREERASSMSSAHDGGGKGPRPPQVSPAGRAAGAATGEAGGAAQRYLGRERDAAAIDVAAGSPRRMR